MCVFFLIRLLILLLLMFRIEVVVGWSQRYEENKKKKEIFIVILFVSTGALTGRWLVDRDVVIRLAHCLILASETFVVFVAFVSFFDSFFSNFSNIFKTNKQTIAVVKHLQHVAALLSNVWKIKFQISQILHKLVSCFFKLIFSLLALAKST